MDKDLERKLHNIALKNGVSDTLAKIIVDIPFLFQKRTIEELELKGLKEEDLEQLKTNFYHKGLGRFYIKKFVHKKLNKKNGSKS